MNSLSLDVLSRALDASISGIIITDNSQPDNPIVYCNKAFENITGFDRNEIIGHNCRFLQKDDRNQKERLQLREAIAGGRSCVVEIRNYKKNGNLFFNELYMSPIKDDQGKVLYFIGVQNDITRRKKAELELKAQKDKMEAEIVTRTKQIKESEEYLNSIVQTVRESLIVMDANFHVISVNEFFLRTFKVSREETLGKRLYDLGNGQWNIPQLRELLENILPTNNPVEEFEVQHDFPHIGQKLMLLNAYRIELEGTYKDQILLAIEDITVRREIERRKDDFLSIASHELKTPLTTIKGYLQILDQLIGKSDHTKAAAMVSRIDKNTDRLNILINDLLDVSRIQSGKFEEHRTDFDFDKLVHEAVDTILASGTSHKITITGLCKTIVHGDEGHLTQVLSNLLSNAVKYSPGKGEISVHCAIVGEYLKCSVIDQGIGISREDQKQLFERFYRVDEVQKSFPGMGIGLYVASQIIKNHGGTLWVESDKGHGSTFSFTLPLHVKSSANG